MKAPKDLHLLCEKFEDVVIRNPAAYNETQVRREFIDPFFSLLGWDVENREAKAAHYRDVVHEDALKMGGATKAPDYAFRIGGSRRFFVEAKRPSVSISDAVAPAYQLRRYAWSAGLTVSVLTDFEEFAIYDCRLLPLKSDAAQVGRVLYARYTDYVSRWTEISSLLSRAAVQTGSIAEYTKAIPERRQTLTVDEAFLTELDKWRSKFATDIAKSNPELVQRELSSVVQKTIDRIVFLRICEDRGIERHGRLRDVAGKSHVYKALCDLFQEAERRYNSGLFHFRDDGYSQGSLDSISLHIELGNRNLRTILNGLYFPDSPYEFSVLPAEIMGQAYERFLGRAITLTNGVVTVDEKPEIRKQGGVYYTPAYVCRYIASDVLNPIVKGRTPKQLSGGDSRTKSATLKVLDPACGSGSFLLEALEFLLAWYRDWYLADGGTKHSRGNNPALYYSSGSGEYRLTIAEKRRILLTHLFGVDIDPQAVEVTKLSLLLKVLEGESSDDIARQMDLFKTRALPDLSSNIKCGNSLIDSSYYVGDKLRLFDDEYFAINAFDWEEEFPEILSDGGFTAVIGNPPYRRELDYKSLMDHIRKTEFGSRYSSPRMDLWYYFVHRGLDLLNDHGRLGFVVNSYWTSGTGAEKLVTRLREGNVLGKIYWLGKLKVFKDVNGQHMMFSLDKSRKATDQVEIVVPDAEWKGSAEPFVTGVLRTKTYRKRAVELFRNGKVDISEKSSVVDRLSSFPVLERYAMVRQGIAENPADINRKTNKRFNSKFRVGEGVFVLTKKEAMKLRLSAAERRLLKPYHDLSDIGRYYLSDDPKKLIIYSTKETLPTLDSCPGIKGHLERFRVIMDQRRETKKGANSWWHLHWPRDPVIWEVPKLIFLQMAFRPSVAIAEDPTYTSFSTNVIVPNENTEDVRLTLLGILNSTVVWKWLSHHAKRRGVGLEINGNVVRKIPVPTEGDSVATSKELVPIVRQLLAIERTIRENSSGHSRAMALRHKRSLEQRAETLAMELYGLSSGEREEVEKFAADAM